jgi:hypothetical protein
VYCCGLGALMELVKLLVDPLYEYRPTGEALAPGSDAIVYVKVVGLVTVIVNDVLLYWDGEAPQTATESPVVRPWLVRVVSVAVVPTLVIDAIAAPSVYLVMSVYVALKFHA